MSSFTFTVTLKSHSQSSLPAGFSRTTRSLVIPYIKHGDTMAHVMTNLNKFRGPESQIQSLYNSLGQELDPSLWSMKITDNLTLYIDQPTFSP